jgi:hypothetical protein
LAFLDEDDAFAPEPTVRSRRGDGGGRQQSFFARRLIAVGIGVGVVILLLLGIKGCLNARKERSFENYASDLTSVVQQSKQLSGRFFGRFNDPGNLDPLDFQSQIAADRGTAQSELSLVESLDTPGELKDEQGELDKAYELRAEGIAGINDQISTALGKKGSTDAEEKIAQYMEWFLASDVLTARAVSNINATLTDEGIDRSVPADQFLPDPPTDWIDATALSAKLAGVAGASGATDCKNEIHGTSLIGTSINGVALVAGSTTTISGGGPYDIDAQVSNGGSFNETDVTVDFKYDGGSAQGTISKLAPGATGDATGTLKPEPQSGDSVTMTVTVRAVDCEQSTDNNSAKYTVTFL